MTVASYFATSANLLRVFDNKDITNIGSTIQTYNASSAIFCYVKCVRFFHSSSRRLCRLTFAPLKVCLWRHQTSLALSTLTSSDVRTSRGLSFEARDKRVVIAQIWRVAARLTLIKRPQALHHYFLYF